MRDEILIVLAITVFLLFLFLGVPLLSYYWAEYLRWVFGT